MLIAQTFAELLEGIGDTEIFSWDGVVIVFLIVLWGRIVFG